jgi:hypothetical protein
VPADHGTPNTGDERDREVEIVAKALGRYDAPEHWDWREYEEPARMVVEALDAARSPQGEDHEAGLRAVSELPDPDERAAMAAEERVVATWPQQDIVREQHLRVVARTAAVAAMRVLKSSPARDGTVAVEDVRPFVVGAMREARAVLESESDVAAKARALRLLNDALGRLSRPFGVSERTERIHDQATKEEEHERRH